MPHWREFLDSTAPSGSYLAWKEVARRTSLSRTTAWRLQKRDDFPAPYAISPGRVAYREDEVDAWRISRDPSASNRAPTAAPLAEAPRARPGQPERTRRADPIKVASAPDRSDDESTTSGEQSAVESALSKPSPGGQRPRRRSQHAQAIAQQMRFDF